MADKQNIPNVTSLLSGFANVGYADIDTIGKRAIESGLCANWDDFSDLMTRYLNNHQDGKMPNGAVFYTELRMGERRAKVEMNGKGIGRIKVSPK